MKSAEDVDERAGHQSQDESQKGGGHSKLEHCGPRGRPIGSYTENQPADPTCNSENDCTHGGIAQWGRQLPEQLPNRASNSIHADDYGGARSHWGVKRSLIGKTAHNAA